MLVLSDDVKAQGLTMFFLYPWVITLVMNFINAQVVG